MAPGPESRRRTSYRGRPRLIAGCATSSKRKWPDFFIVGAQNSGTSSLYAYLRQHPQVFMPALKEPHFFSRLRRCSEMPYPISHVSSQQAYLRLFSRAAGYRAVGEASTSYLWDSAAPRRIHAANPRARIIILLRDPVERAFSHYLMDCREGLQDLPFYEALREDWNRREKGYGVSRLYVELGLYCSQVERYLELFKPKQMRILFFEELRSPEGRRRILSAVAEHLGLDTVPLDRIDTSRVENEFRLTRWNWARQVAGSRRARRLAQALIPPSLGSTYSVKTLLFERFFLKPAVRPYMDPKARDWLCSIHDRDITRLERLLGSDLSELRSTWSREPVAQVEGSPPPPGF